MRNMPLRVFASVWGTSPVMRVLLQQATSRSFYGHGAPRHLVDARLCRLTGDRSHACGTWHNPFWRRFNPTKLNKIKYLPNCYGGWEQ
jgi:hypothetical protein